MEVSQKSASNNREMMYVFGLLHKCEKLMHHINALVQKSLGDRLRKEPSRIHLFVIRDRTVVKVTVTFIRES